MVMLRCTIEGRLVNIDSFSASMAHQAGAQSFGYVLFFHG
jgi:hypothetical protein